MRPLERPLAAQAAVTDRLQIVCVARSTMPYVAAFPARLSAWSETISFGSAVASQSRPSCASWYRRRVTYCGPHGRRRLSPATAATRTKDHRGGSARPCSTLRCTATFGAELPNHTLLDTSNIMAESTTTARHRDSAMDNTVAGIEEHTSPRH